MRQIIRFPSPPGACSAPPHAGNAVQPGDGGRAERVLCATLLAAQDADMALGPLQDIGRLVSGAWQRLRRRPAPALH